MELVRVTVEVIVQRWMCVLKLLPPLGLGLTQLAVSTKDVSKMYI